MGALCFSVFLILCVATVLTQNYLGRQQLGSSCTTPNNEQATCVRVSSCKVIIDAINTKTASAYDFARKSQCNFYVGEYSVCCGSTGLPAPQTSSLIYQHHLLPNSSFCGKQAAISKIKGGNETDLKEFPWMALLKYYRKQSDEIVYGCGGSLISQRYVLTAAHCLKLPSIKLIGVLLGEHDKKTNPDCTRGLQRYKVCNNPVVEVKADMVINHEGFEARNYINDISLIRLNQDVTFTIFIHPICLPSGLLDLPESTMLVFAGWGVSEYTNLSDVKMKIALPTTDSIECGVKLGVTITDTQFCAGAVASKDTCQGDSGGPAMRFIGSPQQWIQEGIVSYGHDECGATGVSGVYTKVSKYVDWIVRHLEP